ncbi:MAG: hypothetical protein P8090_12525 [Gammaproteobacteria bacterium]
MRALICVVSAICFSLSACSTAPTSAAPTSSSAAAPTAPSVAATENVKFLGKQFTRKWRSKNRPVKQYEYYLANETPDDWYEMVEFQVYPSDSQGDKPAAFAARVASAFKGKYPKMPLSIYTNKKTGEVMLYMLYPTSTRKTDVKRYLEFDAFKFFRDPVNKHVLCLHYAKNIEAPSASHPMSDVAAQVTNTRKAVFPAMAGFKAYRE